MSDSFSLFFFHKKPLSRLWGKSARVLMINRDIMLFFSKWPNIDLGILLHAGVLT